MHECGCGGLTQPEWKNVGENVNRHIKTTEIRVRTMTGITFNNRRLRAAQGNEKTCTPFLVSIQGINNLRKGLTAIDSANKHRDKLSGGCEQGVSDAVFFLQKRQTSVEWIYLFGFPIT